MKVLVFLLLGLLALVFAERVPVAIRREAPKGWIKGEQANPLDSIEFSILLKQNNLKMLNDAFERISDPKHADWGKFLKPEQIADMVKPEEDAYEAVKSWLSQVTPVEYNVKSDYITVKTTVQAASKLFDVAFHHFTNPTIGKSFVRAHGIVSIPKKISQHVDFVVGLSEFFSQSVDKQLDANRAFFALKANPPKYQTRAVDPIVTPSLLKQYYNVPSNLVSTNPENFQGIAAFDDYFSMGALETFTQNFNLPEPNVTRIGPDCMPSCDQYESDLDIQYITAMATNVKTVFLNQPANYWILQFAQDTLEMSPTPKVFSVSYGWSELDQCDVAVFVCSTLGYSSTQYVTRTNTELQKLGAAGVSVLVSDGDDGAPSLGGASGFCPIDISHYCPVGGCAHTSTKCGAIQAVNTTSGEMCVLPMGIGSSACGPMLNDQNFDSALSKFIYKNFACGVTIDTDVEGLPHIYSTCSCDQLSPITTAGYTISSFVFNQSMMVFVADYPTSSPYVTSVGATQFVQDNSGSINEIGCSILTGAIITTGGGFSSFQQMPDYQSNAVANYLNTQSNALPPSFTYNPTMRAYPDIAFNGHHYEIFFSNTSSDTCPCLGTEVDGTSCSAPALSGLISLINDQLLNAGKTQLGFLNKLLYQMAAEQPDAFHDIVSGNNNCNRAYCCQYGYSAAPGWDAVSGLGSPNFEKMSAYILAKKGVSSN